MNPQPIIHMRLDTLMSVFKENEQAILKLIDEDPMLRKREHPDGLVIANAGKGLHEPQYEHQLFAKGIVYTRAPYRLVAMPLVKMYNHTCNEVSDATTRKMMAFEGVHVEIADKEDGTFLHAFMYDQKMYLATRSVIEGCEVEGDHFDYFTAAREIWDDPKKRFHPKELLRDGYNMFFEFIHPDTRVITDYGDTKQCRWIGGWYRSDNKFDPERAWLYMSPQQVENTGSVCNLPHANVEIDQASDFDDAVSKRMDEIKMLSYVPEGVVVSFVQFDTVLHRVKIKTEAYLKAHRMKYHCSYKHVVDLLWENPELEDAHAFRGYLIDRGAFDEETRNQWWEYRKRYVHWMRCQQLTLANMQEKAKHLHEQFADAEDVYGAAARYLRDNGSPVIGMQMRAMRGVLTLEDVAYAQPPYKGFKGKVKSGQLNRG